MLSDKDTQEQKRIIDRLSKGWRLCRVFNHHVSGYRLFGPSSVEGVDQWNVEWLITNGDIMEIKPKGEIFSYFIAHEFDLYTGP